MSKRKPGAPSGEESWFVIFERALAYADLAPTEAVILFRIAWHARWEPSGRCGTCTASDATLGGAGDLAPGSRGLISASQVSRIIQALRAEGWIAVEGRGKARRIQVRVKLEGPKDARQIVKLEQPNTRTDAGVEPEASASTPASMRELDDAQHPHRCSPTPASMQGNTRTGAGQISTTEEARRKDSRSAAAPPAAQAAPQPQTTHTPPPRARAARSVCGPGEHSGQEDRQLPAELQEVANGVPISHRPALVRAALERGVEHVRAAAAAVDEFEQRKGRLFKPWHRVLLEDAIPGSWKPGGQQEVAPADERPESTPCEEVLGLRRAPRVYSAEEQAEIRALQDGYRAAQRAKGQAEEAERKRREALGPVGRQREDALKAGVICD